MGVMNRMEIQAMMDKYVLKLLMPTNEFLEACNKLNNDPYALAREFRVSPYHADTRMEMLGVTPSRRLEGRIYGSD